MRKTEIVLIVLVLAVLPLNFLWISGSTFFSAIFLNLLSLLYFCFGFALFNGIRLRHIFKRRSYDGIKDARLAGAIITGFSLAVLLFGILLKSQMWGGGNLMLQIGLFCLVLSLILLGIVRSKVEPDFFKRILIRIGLFGLIGALFYLTPRSYILESKYGDYPDYVNARKAYWAAPDNEMLKEQMYLEREKMEYDRFGIEPIDE